MTVGGSCDNYEDVLRIAGYDNIRVADMSNGKAKDDGYRGVHVYFQLGDYHYLIEIQYNIYYDRQLNKRQRVFVGLHLYLGDRGICV